MPYTGKAVFASNDVVDAVPISGDDDPSVSAPIGVG